jgi:hypothetical protein
MLSYLQDIQDYDILWFLPTDEDSDVIRITSNVYKEPGEPFGGSQMGYAWHIVLFQMEDEDVEKLDEFEAILSDPREYISNLIPQGWYGLVARKTTKSNKFVDSVLDKLKNIC